jgi:hypothetical protein
VLTQLIVSTYKTIAELALWVLIVIGAFVGLAMGKAFNFPWFGFFAGAIGTFLFLAIVLGAALLIADIHTTVKLIEKRLGGKGGSTGDADHGDGLSGPQAVLTPPRLEAHAKAARMMATDGYSAAQISEYLERQGLSKGDAATLASRATSDPADRSAGQASSERPSQRREAAPDAATLSPKPMGRFCRACGQAQEPGGKFCGHCGAPAA